MKVRKIRKVRTVGHLYLPSRLPLIESQIESRLQSLRQSIAVMGAYNKIGIDQT